MLFWMHFYFCFVRFFSAPSQEIGWEERLQIDHILCQVGRKTLTQSVSRAGICCKFLCQWRAGVLGTAVKSIV